MKRLTQLEATTRINAVCESRYSWKLVNGAYIGAEATRVQCTCLKCHYNRFGDLTGKLKCGCPRCVGKARLTPQDISTRIERVSNGRYTFRIKDNNFNGDKSRVMCQCNKCSYEWETDFGTLVRQATGCRRCAGKLKTSLIVAMVRLSKTAIGKYNFEIDPNTWRGNSSRVDCTCLKCSYKWSTTYYQLAIERRGCRKCAGSLKHSDAEATQMLLEASSGRYTFQFKDGAYDGKESRIICKCNRCSNVWGQGLET